MEETTNIHGTDDGSFTVVLPDRGGSWPLQRESKYPAAHTFKNIERLGDKQRKTHVVYFVFCAGFVKIGTTSSLKKRMSAIQMCAPWQTRVVGIVPGGRSTEQFLHYVYKEHAIGGEWFRLGDDMRQAILEMADGIPPLKGALEEEEADYKEWIRDEAERLGL